jgi:hypothetical protein
MPTDWSFLDENGDLITGCASCSGSGLEGFDSDSEVPHKDTAICVKCNGTGA